jgi:protein TonB
MKQAFLALGLVTGLSLLSPVSGETPKLMMPTSNPAGWINPNDFRNTPYGSVRGTVISFRLKVNDQGQATDCAILQSSGSSQVDAAACKALISRARFNPGHDAKGNPTGGTYFSRIHLN